MEELRKKCHKCNIIKLLTDFHIMKNGKYGRNHTCKICRSNARKLLNYSPIKEGEKICTGEICKGIKISVTNFYKDKSSKDGLQTYCKKCTKINIIKWSNNLDSFVKKLCGILKHNCNKRAKKLSIQIGENDIKELYKKQNGRCLITNQILSYNTDNDNIINETKIKNKFNISIDRVDSTKDYTKDNVQLLGVIINIMKSDLTNYEFIDLCCQIDNYNDNKILSFDKENDIEVEDNVEIDVEDKEDEEDDVDISKNKNFYTFIKKIFKDLVHNSKKKKKIINNHINLDDIIELYYKQKGKCALSGNKLTYYNTAKRNDANKNFHIINKFNISIDRINSNKDYCKDNIQLVCAIVNRIKVDLDQDNFLSICKMIKNNKN